MSPLSRSLRNGRAGWTAKREKALRPPVLQAGALAALSALLLDQLSKGWLFDARVERLVLAPMLSISPGLNDGTAFGLASGVEPWLLILVGIGISTWLAALLLRLRSPLAGAALGAAIGGAVGNLADRIRLGAVRDFIDLHWSAFHWPTFNVADIFVVTGLFLFVLLADDPKRDRDEPSDSDRIKVGELE